MTRSRQGKFCGGQPPLGLMRDPDDRGHLILDPETAPVIRKIYDMALDGWGCMRIAKQLMDDKVPITRVKSNTECDVNYYAWGGARISHILRNPFYKGAHLVFRTQCPILLLHYRRQWRYGQYPLRNGQAGCS